jgi:pimeloyl-ACP methyl ester carboxylesterase
VIEKSQTLGFDTGFDTGFHTLHVRRFAAPRGAPVVCLHAIAHDGRDFDDLRRRLAPDFDVIAPDWPGHGESGSDGSPPRAAGYAAHIEHLLDALAGPRVILIGNSIGGAAALTVAARRPDRVRGLVLCNAGGLAPLDGAARFVIANMARFFDAGARGASWYPAAYRFYYERLVLPRETRRRAEIIADGVAKAPVLADAWRGFAEADSDIRALAPRVACPTLLAWARDDMIVAWSRARKAALAIPHRRVAKFRGGHAPFLEDADAFERVFRDFARELTA